MPAQLHLPPVDELRPVIHQHVVLLTSGGTPLAEAVTKACMTVALVYSTELDETLRQATATVSDS